MSPLDKITMRINYDQGDDTLHIEFVADPGDPIVRDVSHGWNIHIAYGKERIVSITILNARQDGYWPFENTDELLRLAKAYQARTYHDIHHVLAVIPIQDHLLYLRFDNKAMRVFDMRPYLDKSDFQALKEPTLFQQAYVSAGTVCWPGNIDIAAETLYDRSAPVWCGAAKVGI